MPDAIDPKIIDKVVAEVLAQIRGRMGSAPRTNSNGQAVELADRVITAELLKEKIPNGGALRITAKAILTPSARDEIKAKGISIQRDTGVSKGKLTSAKGVIVASHLPGVVQDLINDVKKHSSANWRVEMESGVSQVVERIQSVICRGESPQVLAFVKTPHEAACLVNRNAQCRAAVVRTDADVRIVRSEMAANVIFADLSQPTFHGLRRILKASEETVAQTNASEANP